MIRNNSDGAQLCVLVVDDDREGAMSWGHLLMIWGYDAHVVHDGQEAVLAATKRAPDAVILDIGLPIMDGYEVARQLRELIGHKPMLLAVTGRAQPLDRVTAIAAGIDMHFAKPADPEQVRAALERLGQP